MKKLLLCASLILLALPAAAQNDMEWNSVASAGEVDESALGIYAYSGARLKFEGTSIGTIVARYPVVNTNALVEEPSWDTLRLTYLDTNAFAGLTAKLVAVDECSGEEVPLCEFEAADSYGDTTCDVCTFEPVMNFATNAYYVEVALNRSTEFANVELVMLSLSQ
jgi:hypothetical protein